MLTRLGVENAGDLIEARGKASREAGHHRVGIPFGHHAGGEDIAVLVDHALAIAIERTLALQSAIKKGGIFAVMLRQAGITDFDTFRLLEACRLHLLSDALFPSN